MFTGIISRVGLVESVEERDGGRRIALSFAPWERPLEAGESIAINGVCLTATTFAEAGPRTSVDFDVLTETLRVTTLGDLVSGSEVNMERALCMGDPLGWSLSEWSRRRARLSAIGDPGRAGLAYSGGGARGAAQ